MRDRGLRAGHVLADQAAHPGERDDLVTLGRLDGRRRRRRRARGGLGSRRELLDVLPGHPATEPGPGHTGEVDLELGGRHLDPRRIAMRPFTSPLCGEVGAEGAGWGASPPRLPGRSAGVAGRVGTAPSVSTFGASVFGAGAGASGVAVTAPSTPTSTTAISAPACTVSPSLARISRRMPDTGAGTSALTLSVSTSSMGSNSTTLSPGLTSHFEIVPSCTDSPSCGMTTRVVLPAISKPRAPSRPS